MGFRFDSATWGRIQLCAYEIREWLGDYDGPERYAAVQDLEKVRDFLHVLDLMETVLCHAEIAARVALDTSDGSLAADFWQFDVEEFFISIQLEACYQLSNGCKAIQEFAANDAIFNVLAGRAPNLDDTWLARHKVTHFRPDQFESNPIAQRYSILRRPYSVKDGALVKQLARDTGPRLAALLEAAAGAIIDYLEGLHAITCGSQRDAKPGEACV